MNLNLFQVHKLLNELRDWLEEPETPWCMYDQSYQSYLSLKMDK